MRRCGHEEVLGRLEVVAAPEVVTVVETKPIVSPLYRRNER